MCSSMNEWLWAAAAKDLTVCFANRSAFKVNIGPILHLMIINILKMSNFDHVRSSWTICNASGSLGFLLFTRCYYELREMNLHVRFSIVVCVLCRVTLSLFDIQWTLPSWLCIFNGHWLLSGISLLTGYVTKLTINNAASWLANCLWNPERFRC